MKLGSHRFALCLALASCACSTLPENADGQGSTGSCYNVNVCEVLTLDVVNGALGESFQYRLASTTGNGENGAYSTYCQYLKAGTSGMIVIRECDFDEASASYTYDQVRKGTSTPPSTGSELSGVGDHAFLVQDPAAHEARLYAVKGTIALLVDDLAVTADEDVESGFAVLANTLFEH